jgi:hypothetical protein
MKGDVGKGRGLEDRSGYAVNSKTIIEGGCSDFRRILISYWLLTLSSFVAPLSCTHSEGLYRIDN